MKTSYIFLFLLLAQSFTWLNAQGGMIYTSTQQKQWQQKRLKVEEKDTYGNVVISDIQEQRIDGFGGCFNELGWDALSLLSEKQRQEVLLRLFGTEGLRYTFCRLPIGANDYARSWYSLNDTPGDLAMQHFNIERDKTGLIPYIKAAQAINPELKLWASPWSPPVWMKTTGHYATAPGDHNDFTKDNEVSGDHLIQQPAYLEAYALYLSKFVEAYRNAGIGISSLQFQNEPYTVHQWPNCRWTPASMANFLGKYLGPEFNSKHPGVDLWFGTFNCNKMEDLKVIMNDPVASRYICGIGLQWEGKDIVSEVHRTYPGMQLMQTENECGSGTFDWAAAEHTFDLLKTYLNGGVHSYMYWNMILKDDGASTWGWKQNALIRIDSRTKEVVYTPEFYLMKHLSHFVGNGAHRLKVLKGDDVLAFKNPEGRVVILCVNKQSDERYVRISCKGRTVNVQLPAKSFNTITL